MEGSAAELVELVDLLQIADLKFQEKLLMCMNLNLYLRYVPAEVLAKPGSLGPVTGFAWKSPNGSELNITAGESLVSLTFVSPGTLRIRLAPSGEISDPTNGEIVTLSAESTSAKFVETSGGFEFSSGEVIVRGSRKPLMLSLYRAGSLVWKELRPMSWSTKRTWQTLSSVESELLG